MTVELATLHIASRKDIRSPLTIERSQFFIPIISEQQNSREMKNNIHSIWLQANSEILSTYFDETDQFFTIFFLILIGSQILDSRAPL